MTLKKISVKTGKILLIHTRPSVLNYFQSSRTNLDELDEILRKIRAFQGHFIEYLLQVGADPRDPTNLSDANVAMILRILRSHNRIIKKLNGTIRLHLDIIYKDSVELAINANQDGLFFKDFASRTNPNKIYATWATWDRHIRLLIEKKRRIYSVALLIVKKRLYITMKFFFLYRHDKELQHIYQPMRDLYFSIKPDLTWQKSTN
jgi:hypothetical protein